MPETKDTEEAKDAKEKRVSRRPIRHYGDLLVYQQAYRLALDISKLTRAFPREEQFGLATQMRRCCRSVPANIVEGWAKRESAAEFRRHLQLAIGECEETKFWLDLAGDEGCAPKSRSLALKAEYGKLGMMLQNLWKEWRKLA